MVGRCYDSAAAEVEGERMRSSRLVSSVAKEAVQRLCSAEEAVQDLLMEVREVLMTSDHPWMGEGLWSPDCPRPQPSAAVAEVVGRDLWGWMKRVASLKDACLDRLVRRTSQHPQTEVVHGRMVGLDFQGKVFVEEIDPRVFLMGVVLVEVLVCSLLLIQYFEDSFLVPKVVVEAVLLTSPAMLGQYR
jgi:hypothetical protein